MLHSVPSAVSAMTRAVIVNHPNAFGARVFRKTVTRTAPTSVGGLPTLGGLAVLDSEDESEIGWELLGNAYAVMANGQFQPAQMMDRQDANNGAPTVDMLVVPEDEGAFTIKKHDVVFLMVEETGTVMLAYEVVTVETPLNLTPHPMRFQVNRRADLDLL